MNQKTLYEKPRAELLSFHLEDELMSGDPTVDITASGTNPPVGGDGGLIPFGSDGGLTDKSSYQLD